MATADAIGHCARHLDRAATMACVRCGNFACAECLGPPERSHYGHCADCRDREGFADIAWESTEGPWWRRYAATARAAITEPTRTFSSVGTGPVGPPAAFAALSSLVGFSPLIFVILPLAMGLLFVMPDIMPTGERLEPGMGGILLAFVPCAAVFYPSLSFIYFTTIGLLFHVASLALGGKASISESMRAVYYTTAWEPISALALCVYCVPLIGVLLVLGLWVTGAVWRGMALKAYAERTHGLSSGQATLAAAFAAGFWLVVWGAVMVIAVGFALSERL